MPPGKQSLKGESRKWIKEKRQAFLGRKFERRCEPSCEAIASPISAGGGSGIGGGQGLVFVKKLSPKAAGGFLDEFEVAVQRISKEPDRWPRYRLGTHRYMLNRYPYMLIYVVRADSIRVLAVAHTSRQAGYWRDRLKLE